MRLFMNILWFLLLGVTYFLLYVILGIVLCLTLVFIPAGIKCFKGAWLALKPFGCTVEVDPSDSLVRNILWDCTIGVSFTWFSAVMGAVFCLTIIGIPFGRQCFKIMKYSYAPYGAVIDKD